MEQSVRSDSTPVSAGHDTTDRRIGETGRDAAISKMLSAEPSAASTADPVFAAIGESRRLLAAWDAAYRLPLAGDDLDAATGAAMKAFFGHAEDALLTIVPRTPAGCAALCRYALTVQAENEVNLDENPTGDTNLRILDLIARSPMLPGSPPSSDLAEACAEQVERLRHWDANPGSLSEGEADAEMDRWGAVTRRAIEEPSAGPRDLAGKACLSLEDLDRFLPEDKHPDDLHRLLRVILREAIAMGGLADPASRPKAENGAPRPDADLIALGRKFDAAHTAWLATVEANREPDARYRAAIEAAQKRGGPTSDEFHAAGALPGVKRASDAEDSAFDVVAGMALDILRRPARSVADLAVQARAVIPHVWAMGTYEADAALAPDEDVDKEAIRLLIESCCAAAGVDWRGQPHAANPTGSATPSPDKEQHERALHGAIDEHRGASIAHRALINPADEVWVEQNRGDASAEAMAFAVAACDAASARQDQAWRDLFNVRPRTWHQLWMMLTHVAEYVADHRGMKDEPDLFGALIGAVNGLRLASKELTAPHDLSLLSINQLEHLSDICRHQGRVLAAFETSHSESPLGLVLDAESNRLAILGDQAGDEIARRRPTETFDRDLRLESMIKGELAGNGYIEPALLAEAVAAWGTR